MINPRDQYNTNKQGQHQLWHTQQLWQQQADMSIYSPSFLYHIYDQISLPNEQQQQQQNHNQQAYTYGRSSNTNTSNATSNNYNYTLSLNNQSHHLNTASSLCRSNPKSCNTSSSFRTTARRYFYEYKTIVKYSILLLLLALALLTLIKLAIFTPSTATTITTTSALASPTIALSNLQTDRERVPLLERDIDTLESKLIIGEFVILSQNYSHVDSQRALLADRIVKLMDQWILASEFRPNYSRMEVTSIRPNRPTGIIVGCNIILNQSIGFAAPLFGTALYESLVKNHDRLANMPNYIIDKNSIKFSTVPDNDIKRGMIPTPLISPSVSRELAPPVSAPNTLLQNPTVYSEPEPEVEPGQPSLAPKLLVEPKLAQDPLDSLNLVVWSAWSSWSSCVDKNGFCDSGRLHSRLRTCNHQITGEKVDANQCKQRFNSYDQELELEICSRTCQMQQQQQPAQFADSRIQSDAPSASLGPQTAPSVMLDPYLSQQTNKPIGGGASALSQLVGQAGSGQNSKDHLQDLYTPAPAPPSSSLSEDQLLVSTSTERQPASNQNLNLNQQQPQTSDIPLEIGSKMPANIQLESQKVPFCAKMKEREDVTGCGGWCKAPNQICQPVGQNAFKCIHESECLAHEWRCHDSQCIPVDRRCDGHSNCYDGSDERDCPSV